MARFHLAPHTHMRANMQICTAGLAYTLATMDDLDLEG